MPSANAEFYHTTQLINGTELFCRFAEPSQDVSQSRRAVLLLHGHTQTSEMWAPLVTALLEDGFTVLAPDLHGLGNSGASDSGYTKRSMALDFQTLIGSLGLDGSPLSIVGHDLGVFVAYAYAALNPNSVRRVVLMEAVLPGLAPWYQLLGDPCTWHFGFYGQYAEALIRGRERVYLDRFWDEFSIRSTAISEDVRERYAEHYRKPGGTRSALMQFAALEEDAADNIAFAKAKLPIPLLGMGGSASLSGLVSEQAKLLSEKPFGVVIEQAGHWLIEEQPERTVSAIVDFIAST